MGPLTYLKIGGMAVALIATALIADSNGANRVIARDAKVMKRAQDAMQKAVGRMNAAQDALASAEGDRRVEVRRIYLDVPKIIDRPVYRNLAIDDDGVRLLERAAAAANGRPIAVAKAGGHTGDPVDH